MYLNPVSKSLFGSMDCLIFCFRFFGGGLVWWWCTLEVESSDNVLLSPSSLDLPRLRKSTGVIGISIWFDVDSTFKTIKLKSFLNVFPEY